ncbi:MULTISPECIES: STAS domain-containing protein [Isoptericola]|uniref:STAS domain-containing protein n=1 Tax=Isoptericola sediminis TaxID=2733572 RepID=A0A849K616_9MICO|nr:MULTISPECIES: STAS domain-containing protein [unclassified Isoptericola]MDO8145697.1 STAS domain-containing protein [Isoptericola sp. 178]MDO8149754.1 STAS domain-containing protein [Isoptericola sp. b515]MDO8152061.1 STAS domain-containing protein [Isoptericola sp. b408]NNU28848.1 STAS domain-containing protein [Isoptericola sediminis]
MPTARSAQLSTILTDHAEAVRAAWLDASSVELRGRSTRGELEREQSDIYDALVEGLRDGGSELGDAAFDQLRGILADVSGARARLGFTPRETAMAVFALKEGLYSLVDDDVRAHLTPLMRLVDDLGLYTFENYADAREAIITEQAEQLMELSTPVVKLWEGIVAVPLVGTLDSARTQVVMEKLLNTLVETGSEHAIIDITGVPAVDTQVAQHLLKTVVAARLMGAQCTISGIRPQIAQTIVALGIEFGDIRTRASLADALVDALREKKRPTSEVRG